ncbi:tetratricopeptide repeat protein [Paludifilum halophilum]|uniref:Uncharacterized protein n=1 Tax=Paludifilum halophilum TaxID=1642702 RepID=A0A235B9N9_9BACL|nr:tetratricopeptide repeat protein [Paludifilum halophilum]OYD09023.1 hypothetical protein CHM34_04415 [Paludifilum halophilum]
MTGPGAATEAEPIRPIDGTVDTGESREYADANPDRSQVYERAHLKYAKRKYSEALAAVEELLGDEPFHAQGMLLNARILERLDRGDESRAVYEKVLDYHPDFSQAYREYGRFLLLSREAFGEAETHLLSGLEKNPRDAFAHALLAEVYAQTDRKQQALLHLKIAARFPSDNKDYYEVYAKVLMKLGELGEEARRLRRKLVSDSGDRQVRTQFRRALKAQRKGERGLKRYFRKVWS